MKANRHISRKNCSVNGFSAELLSVTCILTKIFGMRMRSLNSTIQLSVVYAEFMAIWIENRERMILDQINKSHH
mgnify:FL=1